MDKKMTIQKMTSKSTMIGIIGLNMIGMIGFQYRAYIHILVNISMIPL